MPDDPDTRRPIRRCRWGSLATAGALTLGAVSLHAPVVDADELTSGGWTTDAAVPSSATRSETVTISVTVTSTTTRTANVDLEIWDEDPAGPGRWERPLQRVWEDAAFTAGISRTFTTTWTVPVDEPFSAHVVKVGLFAPDWTRLYHWNNAAGRIDITATPSTPTTTVAPPTTTATPTTAPTTTGPPTATTVPASTTPPPPTVPPTTAPPPTTTTPSSGWAYVDGFSSLAGWTASRWRPVLSTDFGFVDPADGVCGQNGVLPPNDVQLCGGAVTVAAGSQNYGDTLLRARQPFAGDTLEVDMTLGPDNRLAGWPQILLTSEPMVAPSYYSENGKAATPRTGLAIRFNHRCDGHVAPELVRWNEYVETIDQGTGCAPVGSLTALTRIRVELGGSVRVYANDVLLRTFSGGGVGRWFVYVGAHNHATMKYVGTRSVNATFDNFRFDGPVLPATNVAEAPDAAVRLGDGVEIAYGLPVTLTVRDVPASRGSAWLLASMMVVPTVDWSALRLGYRLNGGTTHQVGLTAPEIAIRTSPAGHSGSLSWAIPVDPAELVSGPNTVAFSTNVGLGGYAPFIGNVEIVTTPGTATPPTTTSTTTTTTSSTTTTVPVTTTPPPTTAPPTTAPPTTAPPTTAPPGGVPGRLLFSEDFSDPASVNRFVYQRIHGAPLSRTGSAEGIDQGTLQRTWMGDHDMNCADPNLTKRGPIGFEPSTDPLQTFEQINADIGSHHPRDDQSVWYCAPAHDPSRAHLMTAMNTEAYGHVDFMPNGTFADVSRVCFDVSWSDVGSRKWIQVAIVPEGYFQANDQRMSYARIGLEGDGNVAQKAVLVRQGTFMYDSFRTFIGAYTGVGNAVNEQTMFGNGMDFLSRFTDKAPRFTHCVEDLGNGSVRITRNFPLRLGGAQSYTLPGAFPNGPARVIFQDVTYDAPKDAAADGAVTWHWDNIQIYGGP